MWKGAEKVTEIKRFVSYIYSYKEGVREKNVGFAKVDSRNGQCKIVVNIKGEENSNGKKQQVYLFYRKGQKIFGIYIGSFQMMNRMGECHVQVQTANINSTGMALEQMGGILIKEENGRICASGWDDEVIYVDQFQIHGEQELKASQIESKASNFPLQKSGVLYDGSGRSSHQEEIKKSEPIIFYDRTWKEDIKSEESENQIQEQVQEMQVQEIKEESQKAEKSIIKEISNTIEKNGFDSTENSVMQEQLSNSIEDNETQDVSDREEEQKDRQEQIFEQQSTNWQEAENIEQNIEEIIVPQEADKENETNVWQENRKREETFEEQEFFYENEDENAWEKLCHRFPKIRAFVDEPERICLKIDLRDLRLLPSENWVLGNNSFLLHGYYNFRYLILTTGEDEEKYLLGIPGIYHPNEKMMASMFGFQGFQSVKNCDKMLGQFGYWCKEVKLE